MENLGPSGVIFFFSFRICHLEPNLMKKEHNQEGTKLKYTDWLSVCVRAHTL